MSRVDLDILSKDARAAFLELARLLGRIAAEDAVDPSTLDTPLLNQNRQELAMTSSKPVRLLTPDEAAQFLSVSQRTVKRLVADGSLRAYKIRRSMRFRLEDLEAYVEQNNWA